MNFLQLEYFLEVARVGNMTAAAHTLHVAQTSVSRSIARLEDDLGVPLFERSGRGVFLNDYGKKFYARAETILRERTDVERELKEMRDQFAGRVAIATSAARQINQLIIQYMSQHPNAIFRQFRITDMQEVKAKLDSGSLDYALTHAQLLDPEYQWEPLIREEFFVLVSAEHPLSGKSVLQISDLKGQRLLINNVDDPDFIEQQCLAHGFSPEFGFIGNEYEIIGPMVEEGVGISLISTLALYDMKKSLPLEHLGKIRVARIEGEAFYRTLGVLCRKHHYLSSAARSFYKRLTDYFKIIELEMK